MSTPLQPIDRERGAALLTALLFLVILMVLGTTGIMNNTLQEHMASNARNRDLAFQAAEHALKTADLWMTKVTSKADLNTAVVAGDKAGIRNIEDRPADRDRNDAEYWRDPNLWEGDDFCLADSVDSPTDCPAPSALGVAVVSAPLYFIERLEPAAGKDYYRVTARGVGGVREDVVVLQSIYEYP